MKKDEKGRKRRKFCLTYLNKKWPNRPWRPRNADSDTKKRVFGGCGER